MNKKVIVKKTVAFVRQKLQEESSGHDWWHIHRVVKMAKTIGKKEKADLFVVELAALLHDLDDWKNNNGDSLVGVKAATDVLKKFGIPNKTIKHVAKIIENISFKGILDKKSKLTSLEGKIVQDADRLDAMGAIGIGRVFAYGGNKGQLMYDPSERADAKEFGKRLSKTAINHFYEKLLLLKDLMNTKTAKKIAKERHKFMEEYLDRFFREWEGKI